MGLAERRAIKHFQEQRFPELKRQVEEAAGKALEFEIAWDKLALEDQAHLYEESWTKVYFQPLIKAFRAVCIDDLGKEAVQSGVRKVVITNESGVYSGGRWATFESGVVTLDHEPTSNVDSIDERAEGLVRVLEKGL